MFATSISGQLNPANEGQFRAKTAFVKWAALALTLVCLNAPAQTDTRPPAHAEFAKQAEAAYQTAKGRYEKDTNNAEAQIALIRACFDWADYATNNDRRAAIAQEGIAVARKRVVADAASVPGHYYLAMNLGQFARTKNLGALKLVSQMEDEFQTVLARDPKFDNAGADRNLGLLYRDAPGWPMSVGSNSKARQHLQATLKIARDYPENELILIESELKWGEKSAAARELKVLDELWPDARKKFTGEEWAASWADWETRREAARTVIDENSRSAGASKKK
jgi:hypothetical protein